MPAKTFDDFADNTKTVATAAGELNRYFNPMMRMVGFDAVGPDGEKKFSFNQIVHDMTVLKPVLSDGVHMTVHFRITGGVVTQVLPGEPIGMPVIPPGWFLVTITRTGVGAYTVTTGAGVFQTNELGPAPTNLNFAVLAQAEGNAEYKVRVYNKNIVQPAAGATQGTGSFQISVFNSGGASVDPEAVTCQVIQRGNSLPIGGLDWENQF